MAKQKTKIIPINIYFKINGHPFRIGLDAKTTSDLNIKQNKMFVAKESWGYTDLQWSNFTGEELQLDIYTRITESYTGDPVQPSWGGVKSFYNTTRTPHSVLKYWAQEGCPCNVLTNLQSYESGVYMITEFSQSSPTYDIVHTELTLRQYEKPENITQTYWKPVEPGKTVINNKTAKLSGTALEISKLEFCEQKCNCTEKSNPQDCTAAASTNVATIQKYLRLFGYLPIYSRTIGRIEISGRFCYHTTQAIKQLQQDYGLTVNGKFNKEVKDVFSKLSGSV